MYYVNQHLKHLSRLYAVERMYDGHRALGIFPHPAMERLYGAWQITQT